PARRVLTWPGRLLAEVLRVVLGEVLAAAGADQQRVPAAYLDPLGLRRLLEMRGGDLEARRERVGPAARDLPRDVQKHDAVHHQIGREVVDAEIVADAAWRRRRGDRVDTAVELQVPSDVADRVDGGRAVLAAEVHDLRRPGHAASRNLAEDLVSHAMGPVERERVRGERNRSRRPAQESCGKLAQTRRRAWMNEFRHVYRTELSPVSFLTRSAYVFPDKVAVVHGARRYTYRELGERVNRLASAL